MRWLGLFIFLGFLEGSFAQSVDSARYDCMQWRCIGPHRGGRTVGAAGVPGKPNVFYIGVNNGGVWRTNDYGRTWKPIFDDQPTGSIGTLALAPSAPDTIYVGSGEGLQRPDLSTGDGIYKSNDAGKTWSHLGLRDAQQITSILVHPTNPSLIYIGALGHPYGPNKERGVFVSRDGGLTYEQSLYLDENTGCAALCFDPVNPRTIYASMWAGRQGPWENGSWDGPRSGLYKSIDGGASWRQLSGGLPTTAQGLGRIGITASPHNPRRLFAMVDSGQLSGVYRSDDAGQSWSRINSESRVCGRGSDFAEIKIDPKDENVVYVANTCMYRSTDGGQNFVAFKGAPGGDDYHTIWINPDNPDIILTASDQGATITVNRGETWSSWYNQPTAQFYHVSTDNQFPYNVYGGQQESGSAGVASRGVDGQITFREWHPVGAEEYGYVAADPLHPNLIYGGKISRYDKNTGDVVSVRPPGAHRYIRTAPVLFSPLDPKTLYFAGEVLFRTHNGGKSWETISPDLTREKATIPESIGIFRTPDMDQMKRRGVIYTVAPSYKDVKTIFCGTDDGLIQVTRDGGKSWKDVTPPEVDSWSKVSLIDAGRFDPNTAYAAINRIRLDDQKPHILRTHDGGQTWKEIVTGLPTGPINTVREDPVRPGLLFCGSEQAVFFSLDDGDNWSPLRLNMPATSIRDLVIHDADVVVGTHGRSFWILDNMSLLRGLTSDVQTTLYKPHTALLVEWNRNTDTPLPPEEPAGKNPPDGAILDYYLADRANIVVLQVLDSKGALVMQISSDDRPEEVNERSLVFPMYWLRPGQILEKSKGSHRFVWDMRTPGGRGVGMGAIFHDTPFGRPPFVAPGKYQVRLMVDGKPYEEPLELLPDPRK